MNTSNKEYSRKTVGITCGLLLFAYTGCSYYIINHRPFEQPKYVYHHTSNIISGPRVHSKKIKSIRVLPEYNTYEISQWITSGDWSHDNYPLMVTIPSKTVTMDLDYVEDYWDDFISDPGDEILYSPDIFQ